VVTSAALIMVAVFSIFLTLPLIELKILGIGMGAAVLIDATVVRGVLLPAALSLLGDRAWRLHRSGARSPRPRAAPVTALGGPARDHAPRTRVAGHDGNPPGHCNA
jgi:RND superfamily putative drug exporter